MRAHQAAPREDRGAADGGGFSHAAEALTSALSDRLRERVAGVEGLSGSEAWTIYRDARSRLRAVVEQRLSRVLLPELHAASLAGRLGRGDESARWSAFADLAASPAFRAGLVERYPTLPARIDAVGRNLVEAVGALAERFVADRRDLEHLAGNSSAAHAQPLGELSGIQLGVGDSHRGGHTVSRLDFSNCVVMYKPRPLEVDAALDTVLAALLPEPGRIGVARTLVREGYGWTAFVEHRYCANDAETELFYAGLGRWLAVMRLIGGTDLHAENIVAHGPVPIVVDAETMLAPPPRESPDDGASAIGVAARILRRAVLRSGILPVRADLLSGIDVSAAGRLATEQPTLTGVRNHPNPDPAPERFWEHIVSGFLELSARIRDLEANGGLDSLLTPFLGCEVRRVARSTQVYGDIRRMLWHPAALRDEAAAVEHARAALLRHARANPGAPDDAATIDAEIADVLAGDTPVFTAHIDGSRLAAALADWRAADLELEARLIRFTLAGVYRDGLPRARTSAGARPGESEHADAGLSAKFDDRRRELAADAVRTLRDTAIHGSDGTVTWIGPVIGEKGWSVRALEADLHSGQAGVALCLAGYAREAASGRAEHVRGISELLPGTLASLRAAEDRFRSPQIGALVGLAGQVWTWTALSRLLDDRALLDRAVTRAELLSQELRGSDGRWSADWSAGLAGTITPLLDLADATGDGGWLEQAAFAAELLARTVESDTAERKALTDEAGFAHGRAGVGWALHRIAASVAGDGSRRDRWRALAEDVFDPDAALEQAADEPSWCRGVAGIGLVARDLATIAEEDAQQYTDAARRAAQRLTAIRGYDSRSLCHGGAGVWEFLTLDAALIGQLERETNTAALTVEATAPGLLNGVSGTVLTLLRMHPGHELPSPLLLGA